jgi:prepilin signal peptidase PulO-like enzyme (type II secretory pathway)
MDFIFYFLIFILGLAAGSFLNCVIHRLEKKESFLWGRSFCPQCNHQLKWQDLIPLLSFLFLRQRCRYCRQKISWQYPLAELATAASFFLIFTFNIPHPAFYILISCFLIIIFVYDLRHYIIPDKIIYPAILVSGIWYLSGISLNFYTKYEILNTIYSAVGTAGFFLLIVFISGGRWMGIGDVKLAFLMGLILGFPNILVSLFLAFFLGAIIGIGLVISGKKQLSSEVPFGPFLVTGTFIALFWGQKIVDWYLNILAI